MSAGTRSLGLTVRRSHIARGQSWIGVEIGLHILGTFSAGHNNTGSGDFYSLQEADPSFHQTVCSIWEV
jgi:hypothetical protein